MIFDAPRPRRKPSLTPMIDVVFLLLVFFMLASRFGAEMQLPLKLAGGATRPYVGPPRLVVIEPEQVRLNGTGVAQLALSDALAPLMSAPEDAVILRAAEGVSLQRLVEVMDHLARAGMTNLVVLE